MHLTKVIIFESVGEVAVGPDPTSLVPSVPGEVGALVAREINDLLQVIIVQGITDPCSGGWSLISIAAGASTAAGCACVSTRLIHNM